MIKITEKMQTNLIIISSILWIYIVIASWIGYETLLITGLIAASLISSIYFVLGATVNNKIEPAFILFVPIILTFILWSVSFILVFKTKGFTENFIMGMHPGQFYSAVIFWLGTFIFHGITYAVFFDKYIFSEANWNNFIEEVEKTKKNKKSEYSFE